MIELFSLANWSSIGVTITTASAVMTGLMVIWGKFIKPVWNIIAKSIKASQKLDDYFQVLDTIAYEFKPNGGNSLRDVINRLERHTVISEKKIHSLINAHSTAMYETFADGTIKWVSKEWLDITGLSLDEAIGYGWINSIHEQDRLGVQKAWQQALEEKRDFQMSYRTQNNKHINSKATPVLTANKIPIGWIGLIETIDK